MTQRCIKSISIPKYMDDFLAENPEISLSKCMQSKILEIMDFQTKLSNSIKLKNLLKFQKEVLAYLEEMQLMERFAEWRVKK